MNLYFLFSLVSIGKLSVNLWTNTKELMTRSHVNGGSECTCRCNVYKFVSVILEKKMGFFNNKGIKDIY